ncbi:MAG: molybdate ABC transporter permease subunit [Nostocaceae cyanobacterium]|nr:molybdate ABC transporter permease subunit [Nostocaceae cyanobacterium]
MPADLSPLWISLKTAFLATFITFFLGINAAYWMLGYRGRGKSLIEGIFVSPLILPPTVVGFLLLLLFGKNGPIGKLTQIFDWTIVFTWYAAVIAATVVSFPLMYKTALGAFAQIDSNLLQVARTLGASEWTIFWRISLPLAFPGIVAGITLAFARALGEFGATLMLAGNIPGQTQTIPMAIYFAVEAGAIDQAWFWSVTIMVISLFGIIGVNFWLENRTTNPRKRRKYRQQKNQLPITHSQLPITNSGLIVDIEKELSGFNLQVDFSADEQTLGLLGGSGAGKSMILRCIAGIQTPTKGRIVLNGRILFDSQRGVNIPSCDRHIGFLVQNYALFPHMTVGENIAFGLPKGLRDEQIRQRVEAQLLAMHLEGLANRYPHQLSGGQQQRVALARALASQPQALLLDEPFSALDTHLRSKLEQEMITRLADYQGVTLFVTHNLEEAYRVCSYLLVMEHGKPIHYGSKQEIFQQPATFSVAQLTGCKNFSRAVLKTSRQVEAVDWDCNLKIKGNIPPTLDYVGIRAHQLAFTKEIDGENTFACWLARTSETPHRMTLFLKLHQPPVDMNDYHLQAEVFKEKWAILKDQPFPWYVRLDPQRLLLINQ